MAAVAFLKLAVLIGRGKEGLHTLYFKIDLNMGL